MSTKDKKRVLFIADGVVPTGFATVAHNILSNLDKEKYEICHLAVNYFGDPHSYDWTIYPATTPETFQRGDRMGFLRLPQFVGGDFDLIYILNDVWVIDEYLTHIKDFYEQAKKPIPKIITYFPVDGEGYTEMWFRHFDIVDKAVVYTNFGKSVVLDAYPELFDKLEIIPHGAANKEYFHIIDKSEARKELFKDIPNLQGDDSFIVLNFNRNQPRKMLDIAILGFLMFSIGKPANVRYYHHAGLKDVGWDIPEVIKRQAKLLGLNPDATLADRFLFTSHSAVLQTISMQALNRICNACDIGINTSAGEGWGLSGSELSYLGKPSVLSNNTVNPELYGDVCLLADTAVTIYDKDTILQRHITSASSVAEQLEKLYSDKELYNKLSKAGIEKFSKDYYDWSYIAKEMWLPLFDEVVGD